MSTDKKETLASRAAAWSLTYEKAAKEEKKAIQLRKRISAAAVSNLWGEEAVHALIKEAEAENPLFALPLIAMADTYYGKKANYHSIVKTWAACQELDRGFALLALANTLEQMSEAIYEHYRALADLLRDRLEGYFQNYLEERGEMLDREGQEGEETSGPEEKTDRALAALALLKACRLEILPGTVYGMEARRLFKETAAPYAEPLRDIADGIWGQITALWGAEVETRGVPQARIQGGGPWDSSRTDGAGQGSLDERMDDGQKVGDERDGKGLTILHKTARSLVLELPGEDIYHTEEYEIWVNGVFAKRDSRMVTILNGLCPKCVQRIEVRRKDGTAIALETETPYEYVTLNVRRFGAKGDGMADDTAAIQTAILCCPRHSRVYIPAGTYRIRNLFLKSDLVLEIGKGAVLQGFQEREDFPILPGRTESSDGTEEYILGTWEGNPLPSMASILNGIHVENVVICGEGTIDGGGDFDRWWVNGINSYPPYRPKMMFFSHCRNITVQGIRVQNSPSWNLHPYFSERIRVYGITLQSPDLSHNTDGINPESCMDVEIVGVFFSVGDDCIAIKSGKIYMGKTYRQPSRDIRIRQCLMEKGHGAVTIGSEIAGGILDVSVTKCLFRDTDRGLRIKTRRGRGKDAVVDGISFDTVVMDQVKAPFVVNSFYFCDPDGMSDYVASQEALPVDERTPQMKKLTFSHIICRNAHYTGVCIYGLPEQKVEEVVMNEVHISYAPDAKEGIAAMMRECTPTCRQGILARNVKRLVLKNVHLEGAEKELEWEGMDEIITG